MGAQAVVKLDPVRPPHDPHAKLGTAPQQHASGHAPASLSVSVMVGGDEGGGGHAAEPGSADAGDGAAGLDALGSAGVFEPGAEEAVSPRPAEAGPSGGAAGAALPSLTLPRPTGLSSVTRLGSITGPGAPTVRLGSLRDSSLPSAGIARLGSAAGASVGGGGGARLGAAASLPAAVAPGGPQSANARAMAARARAPSPDPAPRKEKRKSVRWADDSQLASYRCGATHPGLAPAMQRAGEGSAAYARAAHVAS